MNCFEGGVVSLRVVVHVRIKEGRKERKENTNTHHPHIHLKPLQRLLQADLDDGRFLGFAECEVPVEDAPAEGEGVHVFGAGGVDEACAG